MMAASKTQWDTVRIENTVNRNYVCSHLLPEEIERLDRPLGFGDGLTDGTYWEWIEEKAKRIFLILVDLGVPDQIFGLIDDSWDDDDLPIALDQVERLALTPRRDDKTDKRFFTRQYHYLTRQIDKGSHMVYTEHEIVPLEVLERKLGMFVDRVELANRPGEIFLRRRIPIGTSLGSLPVEELLYEINGIKSIQNDHITSYFASYTHQGFAYVLFTPANDYNLKAFLANQPAGFKVIPKQERRSKLMNWIHCLVDTLCFIHNKGISHGNIKPSTVLFNNDYHIFYSDISRLGPETLTSASEKAAFDKESYDYAAPEQWYRPITSSGQQRRGTVGAPSSSPESNYTFSINRGNSDLSAHPSGLSTPNPHLNAQAADIFSLGCIILELLTFHMKRQTKTFASHRSAKHKTAGRGGAVLDASFHKNISQVESWMAGLAKDAEKKKDDPLFRGVPPMLKVVSRMLSVAPQERPLAQEVEQRMYNILTETCRILEPHCVHQYGGWDFGLANLHINKEEPGIIIPKRYSGSSSGSRGLEHRRTNSGAKERDRIQYQQPRQQEAETSSGGSGAGLLHNLSLRSNKVRPWQQPPMHAGNPNLVSY